MGLQENVRFASRLFRTSEGVWGSLELQTNKNRLEVVVAVAQKVTGSFGTMVTARADQLQRATKVIAGVC